LTDDLGFSQSQIDPCVFWRNKSILVIYTDDTVLTGPDPSELDTIIHGLEQRFQITHQSAVKDFLGVKIDRDMDSGTVTLTQPHLIASIIADLGLKENSNPRNIPALSSHLLHKFADSNPHNEPWHYRSVVGKLNFSEKSTRPDITSIAYHPYQGPERKFDC
jgi:Reverse transcriptase (RNA-dependent DNA polymerase)